MDNKEKDLYESEVKLKLEHRNELGQENSVNQDNEMSDDYEIVNSPENKQENRLYDYDPNKKDSFLGKSYNPNVDQSEVSLS